MTEAWQLLADEFAARVAEQLAPRLAGLVREKSDLSPWLTTSQAISYTGIPEGTFRKLVACGKIPSHGGRSKIYYRPEIDQALLASGGLAEDTRRLRRVR